MESEIPHYALMKRDGDEIVLVSWIRFRLNPGSENVARQLLADRRGQVMEEGPERSALVWPLSTEFAIFEQTIRGPMAELSQTAFAHRMAVEAELNVLGENGGFSEIVVLTDFEKTNIP